MGPATDTAGRVIEKFPNRPEFEGNRLPLARTW